MSPLADNQPDDGLTERLQQSAARLDVDAPAISLDELQIRLSSNARNDTDAEISLGLKDSRSAEATRHGSAKSWRARAVFSSAAALVAVAAGYALLLAADASPSFDPMSTPPLPNDVPETGITPTPEQLLILSMAESALIAECMTNAGFDFIAPTGDDLIVDFGQWSPHPVLGIQRAGAASRVGYQESGSGGRGTLSQAAATQTMTAADREAYLDALVSWSDDLPGTVVKRADGKISQVEAIQSSSTGCVPEVEQHLGFTDVEIESHRLIIEEDVMAIVDVDAIVAADSRTIAAVDAWRQCVTGRLATADIDLDPNGADTATTTMALTNPNDLARRFLRFDDQADQGPAGANPQSNEVQVAVADAECQTETNLQHVWAVVETEVVRFHLGDGVIYYDKLARMYQHNVAVAQTILAERSIEPPLLD